MCLRQDGHRHRNLYNERIMGYNRGHDRAKVDHLKKSALFFILGLVFLTGAGYGQEVKTPKPDPMARLELGFDQTSRRYFRPELKFDFPVGSSRLFIGTIYEQRLNSRLQGDADLWLKAGVFFSLGAAWDLETSFNHMSRHGLSRFQQYVLSINELIGRLWWTGPGVRVAFGLGAYLNDLLGLFKSQNSYRNLAVLNASLPEIFGSGFSLRAEMKFVNFRRVLHEVELRVGLSKTAYLFARNTTTYEYPNRTDLGLGLQSDALEPTAVTYVRCRTDILPSDEEHKLVVNQVVLFDILRTPGQRLSFKFESDLPILRGKEFLGLFRPSWLNYPFELDYERALGRDVFLFGYGLYQLTLTIDTSHKYAIKRGLGLGLRNQRVFEALLKPFRYEISGGLDFDRDYDARLALGLNTVKAKVDFGGEVTAQLNSKNKTVRVAVISEFGGATRVRLFAGFDTTRYERPFNPWITRFWLGFEFSRLFRDES